MVLNKTNRILKRKFAQALVFFASLLSVSAFAVTNDTYSIDEDSVLNVGAPGILLNDILPLGSEPLGTTVTAVDLTPSTVPGTAGTRTAPGDVGGLGRPLVVNADGSFSYDPRGAFDFLAAGESIVDTATAGSTTQYINSNNGTVGNVSITVTGVNDDPTDITLSSTTLPEHSGANFVVGNFSSTDADSSDTHTYSLRNGFGAGDNDLFDIDGTNLRALADLDAKIGQTYSIRVQTSDPSNKIFVKFFLISVAAVAVAPNVAATDTVTPNEDVAANLGISASLNDATDETLALVITGLPTGASITDGTNSSTTAGTDVSNWNFSNITTTSNEHDDSDYILTITATASEAANASTAQMQITTTVKVMAVVDTPTLIVNGAVSGNEDTAIPLSISGNLTDLDGSESLTMVITGHPASTTFSAGSDLGGGSWSVDVGDLSGLTISAAANNNDDFSLTVTSTAEEAANGDTTIIADTINVQIQAVNDEPTLLPVTFFIDENTPNGRIIGTLVAVDVEPVGGESAQGFTYVIDGTAFSIDNGGVIRVADVDQLDFETTSQFTPTVTASDTGLPSLSDSATITINLNGLDDNVPEAVDDDVNVDEQETVFFSVVDNDIGLDVPAQTLLVSEVNGDAGLVGVAIEVEVDGLVIGSLTINGSGAASFITTSDVTVEKFLASATYRVTDGGTPSNEGTINLVINPINDNQPELTIAGLAAEADGITFEEDQYPSLSTAFNIIVNNLFLDLDIDFDGIVDSNTGEDNDSLNFVVIANSDPAILQYSLDSGALLLFSSQDVHGTATLTLRATDIADPSANISVVEFDLVVTVSSQNDSPIYQLGFFNNYSVEEDSGDIEIDLGGAFSDADLNDDTPGDDQLIYRVTMIDSPNEFVLTTLVDETTLNVVSDDTPDGEDRTLVVETTGSSLVIPINEDAHGELRITVRATDLGRPPEQPADALPLFDESTFTVTIQGVGDDQPEAVDDHFSDFPELVIAEDSSVMFFDAGQNDYHGDTPPKIVIVGQTIVDSSGTSQALVSNTRLADPNDTGDLIIQLNGEVSCADQDCLDARRGSTSLSGDGISDMEIVYRPRANFNGEDSFTYCIEDSEPAGEAPFNPPNDPRCATITVNVTPVNDKPSVSQNIVIPMEQADDLVVSEADGLKNYARDLDNTDIDGQACTLVLGVCTPGEAEPDQLYFYFAGAVTEHGQLIAPFTDDGAFNYRPDATFSGTDNFAFQVCDIPTPGDVDHCADGSVSVQIRPLEGAAEGSTDGAVQFDYQLAQTPLELPIGPEPNVLIVNDDSGSMNWDIASDGDSGVYQLATGNNIHYINASSHEDAYDTAFRFVAPAEEDAPNQGIWRLRSASFNTLYYNPEIRYKPWEGLDTSDVEFPDSPPLAARHNPLNSSPTTNLTATIDFTGKAVVTSPLTCATVCTRYRRGRCISTRTSCSGGTSFTDVQSIGFYIPRYYEWTDLDGDDAIDSTPSPANEAGSCSTNRVLGCSEGQIVEIVAGTTYPRGAERTDCGPTECTYDEEIQNFANWFTYFRTREFTAKAALGVVVANAENLRLGYARLNTGVDIQPIKSMNTSERTGAKADLLDSIYATSSFGGTPLRESLNDAGEYLSCTSTDIFTANRFYATRTSDEIVTSPSTPGDTVCPVLAAPDGNCQQNFTLLITDGTWSGDSPATGDSDGDGNSNFDGGAFAGASFTTLADVAINFYERDLHSSLNNEVPTTARDIGLAADDAFENETNEIMHQHMTTYTVGFGVKGFVDANPLNYATAFNWGNPFSSSQRKTDDVRHAAYNGRGEYLDASNAGDLANKLVEAFDEFSQGSGAASAVSFNSQEIQEDTLIFRAFYNTKINTGDLTAQSLTDDGLLEEPVWSSAEALDLINPNDREILTYDDVAGVGIAFRPGSLNTDQRNAFISDLGASEEQKNTEVIQRVNYLRGDSANERPVGAFRERPVVKGRLGDIVHSTPVFVGFPNRIGRDQSPFPQDDLYSTFRAANVARDALIYVSSNDGMMHGMDVTDGSEVFGFVPNNLMLGAFSRKITNLLDFEYGHKFLVDLTPAVNDVYMDSDGDGDKEWITFLLGGHGAGAKAYFALNVTDPTKLTETTASDVVLWEFTEEDDTYPTDSDGNPLLDGSSLQREDLQDTPQPVKDLGYSFSVPTIAMSNLRDSNEEQIWISMFGNGYNATAGIAKLFVLFIDGGVDGTWCHPDMIHNETLNGPLPAECIGKQDFMKIDTGFGVQDGFPNGLGTPRGIDVDGNGTIDYAYAGDTIGNFFRFDLTSSNYDEWSFTKIFAATYEDSEGIVTSQPITTQPIVTSHPTEDDGFIVIFATGSYITIPDGRSKEIQSIYGLWDRLSPELLEVDDLVQQKFINLFDAEFGNVRALTNAEVDYSVVGAKKGWYNHLDAVAVNGNQLIDDTEFPGERAIRNIQLRRGLAFVNSVIPRSDTSCVDIAGGFALSFCPGTGGTNCLGGRGIFDLDNDGVFDVGDEADGQVVAGTRFEDAVPTGSSFIEDKRITQLSDKSLDSTKTNTSGGSNTGRLSWKELDSIN
ncbi:MAG: type IV pilus assembly protein PilY1 [Candidatus Azotimanducaceae bacterium]|jgi:type IV pilus assembly protein PilY1